MSSIEAQFQPAFRLSLRNIEVRSAAEGLLACIPYGGCTAAGAVRDQLRLLAETL
jgi:hypothetical protein